MFVPLMLKYSNNEKKNSKFLKKNEPELKKTETGEVKEEHDLNIPNSQLPLHKRWAVIPEEEKRETEEGVENDNVRINNKGG